MTLEHCPPSAWNRVRHRVEYAGTAVDATLIEAPSSTKNKDKARDPEVHSSQKGNEWHFGMKAHIGVDADSGLVHTVRGTAGNVADVTEGNSLLHGQETDVYGDAGYQGADKRPDAKASHKWHVAMRPGKRKKLDKDNNPIDALIEQVEKIKASIRAKVEHPYMNAPGLPSPQFMTTER